MTRIYVFKRLFKYVSKYKSKLLLIAVLGLIGVVFEVAKPLPIKLIIDNVLSDQPLPHFLSNLFTDTKEILLFTQQMYCSLVPDKAFYTVLKGIQLHTQYV